MLVQKRSTVIVENKEEVTRKFQKHPKQNGEN